MLTRGASLMLLRPKVHIINFSLRTLHGNRLLHLNIMLDLLQFLLMVHLGIGSALSFGGLSNGKIFGHKHGIIKDVLAIVNLLLQFHKLKRA